MNAVIMGKRGTGKTYWMKRHIDNSVLPCVIVDTMQEYGDVAVWTGITDGLLLDKFKMRFTPADDTEFAILMSKLARTKTEHGINVYIDEIDYWSNSQWIPQELANNLRYSRHYNLNLYMSVRNPSEINRRITAMSDVFIIFNITEPRYLQYFKDFDMELPERIKGLKPYEHIQHYLIHHD